MSGGDPALAFIYGILLLMLVGSSLAVRRIPIGTGLKMFAAWALIFAALFLAFTLKDDFKALGKRMMAELSGESKLVRVGDELRIRKSDDGHFWVDGKVNGETVAFLVDSGATTTTLSAESAGAAGVEPSSRFRTIVSTANGRVSVGRGRIRLNVGTIERQDFSVHINASDDTNLLGMNFLSSLTSWRVEGDWLVLQP